MTHTLITTLEEEMMEPQHMKNERTTPHEKKLTLYEK